MTHCKYINGQEIQVGDLVATKCWKNIKRAEWIRIVVDVRMYQCSIHWFMGTEMRNDETIINTHWFNGGQTRWHWNKIS